MALGLPGLRVDGPIFITGEPLREYNFQFRLTVPDDATSNIKNGPIWTKVLFSTPFLLYISGLAEQVNLPNEEFQLGQVQMSTLQIPFPKGFTIPTFSVQYLEDELMSVARFHMIWQQNIRSSMTLSEIGGLQFYELGRVCCSAIYAPSKKIATPEIPISAGSMGNVTPPVEIPMGGETFPYIFPTSIQRSPGNKAGQNISKTTVTYSRVPDTRSFNWSDFHPDNYSTSPLEEKDWETMKGLIGKGGHESVE